MKKTTLNIDNEVMARLKEEAARQRRTMSTLVEAALRRMLEGSSGQASLPELPTFKSGGHQIAVEDREALFQAMEGR